METKVQADGSSVLIGTNLRNYAMPIICYEQGDLGRIEENRLATAAGASGH